MIKEAKKEPWRFLANVSCKYVGREFKLTIDDITFSRTTHGGNYRWKLSYLVGRPEIVRMLTRYYTIDREQPSSEAVGLMEGAVSVIEDIFKSLEESIEYEVERRIELRGLLRKEKRRRDKNQTEYYRQVERNLNRLIGPDSEVRDIQDESYLYLFRHDNGLTKIGFSKNPEKREKTIQAEDPRVHMLATRRGNLRQEARLHKIFAEKRVRGEWFDLNENDIDWLFFVCGFQKHEEFNLQSQ